MLALIHTKASFLISSISNGAVTNPWVLYGALTALFFRYVLPLITIDFVQTSYSTPAQLMSLREKKDVTESYVQNWDKAVDFVTKGQEKKSSDKPLVEENQWDVVIIGAGITGASFGHVLASRGVRVLNIERDLTEPARIVGELMQPAGVQSLADLNLLDCIQDIDLANVKGYAIYMNDTWGMLPYPSVDGKKVEGKAFHNERFLANIRRKLRTYKTNELRQGTVTKVLYSDDGTRMVGVMYKNQEGVHHVVRAPLTVVCDGFNSTFRAPLHKGDVTIRSRFLGLLLKNPDLPHPGHGHVIISKPTPMLVYPISPNECRMLIDFPQPIPSGEELMNHLMNHVLPQLPERIKPSFLAAVKAGDFKAMPNRHLDATPLALPGVLLLGDSLNMRHPLTGGGMTCLYSDIKNVLKLMNQHLGLSLKETNTPSAVNFKDSKNLDALILEHYNTRDRPIAVINILADALYDVFCQEYPELRDACFYYLKLGGWCSDGPIRFLSGVSSSQAFLLLHFFSVAFYGLGRVLLPIPTPHRISRAFCTLRNAVKIIIPRVQRVNTSFFALGVCKALRTIFWV